MLKLAVDPLKLGDGRLPGRDNEREALIRFLSARLPTLYSAEELEAMDITPSTPAPSLYVSGQPGTGKTALLLETLAEVKRRSGVRTALLNCTTVTDIWSDMLAALDGKAAAAKDARATFERRMTAIDSTDQLCVV